MTKKTVEQLDASIARWQSRLKRAVNAIERLQKQRKRMMKPKPLAQVLGPIENVGSMPPVPKGLLTLDKLDPPPTDDGIPTFLQRRKPDPVAEQIVAEQQEAKRRKTSGRLAKMKAKKSGETRKMPLTGKAALEAIRNS